MKHVSYMLCVTNGTCLSSNMLKKWGQATCLTLYLHFKHVYAVIENGTRLNPNMLKKWGQTTCLILYLQFKHVYAVV